MPPKQPYEEPSSDKRLIEQHDPDSVLWAMKQLGLADAKTKVQGIEIAGEGNMNVVLRVYLHDRSIVLKQSRPFVQRYPSIAAPEDRVLAEIGFYKLLHSPARGGANSVSERMPALLASSESHYLIALEDLGPSSDYTSLYGKGTIDSEGTKRVFAQAATWLCDLHQLPTPQNNSLGCVALRRLNHEHMFVLPMADPPHVDLEQISVGLSSESMSIRTDLQVRAAMEQLGTHYIDTNASSGEQRCLLHGDFYPGSWLQTESGIRIIDPEFCFVGPAEFDLGVLAAHFEFCCPSGDASSIDCILEQYVSGGSPKIDRKLAYRFAGAELIRRTIGVAQLPLTAKTQQRMRWLKLGRELLAD